MAQHPGGRGAGQLATEAIRPFGQRPDHVPAGLPGRGHPPCRRVGRAGGGERGLQLGEELASARPERLPADQPEQRRGRGRGMDLGHGGAELAPLSRQQPGLGAGAGVQHRVEGEREPVNGQVGLAGPGREGRQDPGRPPALEVGCDRRARHGPGARADLEEPGRAVAGVDPVGPGVGVVADGKKGQPGDPDPEAGLERPDDQVAGQVGRLTHRAWRVGSRRLGVAAGASLADGAGSGNRLSGAPDRGWAATLDARADVWRRR